MLMYVCCETPGVCMLWDAWCMYVVRRRCMYVVRRLVYVCCEMPVYVCCRCPCMYVVRCLMYVCCEMPMYVCCEMPDVCMLWDAYRGMASQQLRCLTYLSSLPVLRTLKTGFLRHFAVHETALWTTIPVLYSTSLERLCLITGSFYPLTNITPCPITPSPWHPPLYSVSIT